MVRNHPPPRATLKSAREAYAAGEIERALELLYLPYSIQLPRQILAEVSKRLQDLERKIRLGGVPREWKSKWLKDIATIAKACEDRKVKREHLEKLDQAQNDLQRLASRAKDWKQQWRNFTDYWQGLKDPSPEQVAMHGRACERWQRFTDRSAADSAEEAIKIAEQIIELTPMKLSVRPRAKRLSVHRREVAVTYEVRANQSVQLRAFLNGQKLGEKFLRVLDTVPWKLTPPDFVRRGMLVWKGRTCPQKGIRIRRLPDPSDKGKDFVKASCEVGVDQLRLGENLIEVKAYCDGKLAVPTATTTVYRRPYRSYHVVAVGCGQFRDPKLSPLGYAARDAIDFAILALNVWGVQEDRVALFLDLAAMDRDHLRGLVGESCEKHGWVDWKDDSAVRQLSERIQAIAKEPATLQCVKGKLDQLASRKTAGQGAVHEEDAVVVYFSTHGVVHPKSQRAYLALADTQTAEDSREPPGYCIDELPRWAEWVKAKHVLLLIDACHSGRIVNAPARAQPDLHTPPEVSAKSRARVALASCRSDKRSLEALGNGLFTHHLLSLLVPGAKSARLDEDDDGWITAGDVGRALCAVNGLRDAAYGPFGKATGDAFVPAKPIQSRLWLDVSAAP